MTEQPNSVLLSPDQNLTSLYVWFMDPGKLRLRSTHTNRSPNIAHTLDSLISLCCLSTQNKLSSIPILTSWTFSMCLSGHTNKRPTYHPERELYLFPIYLFSKWSQIRGSDHWWLSVYLELRPSESQRLLRPLFQLWVLKHVRGNRAVMCSCSDEYLI